MARTSMLVLFVAIACLAVACNGAVTGGNELSGRKLLQANCNLTRASGSYAGEDNCAACPARPGTKAWCCTDDDFASPALCKEADPNTCCSGPAFYYREDDDDTDDLDEVWCVPTACVAAFDAAAARAYDDRR